jgi:hypothetical protein
MSIGLLNAILSVTQLKNFMKEITECIMLLNKVKERLTGGRRLRKARTSAGLSTKGLSSPAPWLGPKINGSQETLRF